ncbi:phage holin family protein [Bacteriovorax sp. PP10]|uniref:Phage holin family protein n=1 Tax=Bacteriovorax antarcticus TaxID=3088717 RepID=A0ABU5VU16_9BACT|nr:phage holin family protein [Bacteriovorax sp. PP10]MEA9355140.1 phage holin family protein [Bacteriovorax sp. PP10]
MLYILLVWILSALALLITSKLVKGFEIKDFKAALIASLVIGLLNAVLRPILLFLTLPINILTLGLFTFVVNAIVLRLAAGMMSSFKIADWMTAIIGAFVLVIVQILMNIFVTF